MPLKETEPVTRLPMRLESNPMKERKEETEMDMFLVILVPKDKVAKKTKRTTPDTEREAEKVMALLNRVRTFLRNEAESAIIAGSSLETVFMLKPEKPKKPAKKR